MTTGFIKSLQLARTLIWRVSEEGEFQIYDDQYNLVGGALRLGGESERDGDEADDRTDSSSSDFANFRRRYHVTSLPRAGNWGVAIVSETTNRVYWMKQKNKNDIGTPLGNSLGPTESVTCIACSPRTYAETQQFGLLLGTSEGRILEAVFSDDDGAMVGCREALAADDVGRTNNNDDDGDRTIESTSTLSSLLGRIMTPLRGGGGRGAPTTNEARAATSGLSARRRDAIIAFDSSVPDAAAAISRSGIVTFFIGDDDAWTARIPLPARRGASRVLGVVGSEAAFVAAALSEDNEVMLFSLSEAKTFEPFASEEDLHQADGSTPARLRLPSTLLNCHFAFDFADPLKLHAIFQYVTKSAEVATFALEDGVWLDRAPAIWQGLIPNGEEEETPPLVVGFTAVPPNGVVSSESTGVKKNDYSPPVVVLGEDGRIVRFQVRANPPGPSPTNSRRTTTSSSSFSRMSSTSMSDLGSGKKKKKKNQSQLADGDTTEAKKKKQRDVGETNEVEPALEGNRASQLREALMRLERVIEETSATFTTMSPQDEEDWTTVVSLAPAATVERLVYRYLDAPPLIHAEESETNAEDAAEAVTQCFLSKRRLVMTLVNKSFQLSRLRERRRSKREGEASMDEVDGAVMEEEEEEERRRLVNERILKTGLRRLNASARIFDVFTESPALLENARVRRAVDDALSSSSTTEEFITKASLVDAFIDALVVNNNRDSRGVGAGHHETFTECLGINRLVVAAVTGEERLTASALASSSGDENGGEETVRLGMGEALFSTTSGMSANSPAGEDELTHLASRRHSLALETRLRATYRILNEALTDLSTSYDMPAAIEQMRVLGVVYLTGAGPAAASQPLLHAEKAVGGLLTLSRNPKLRRELARRCIVAAREVAEIGVNNVMQTTEEENSEREYYFRVVMDTCTSSLVDDHETRKDLVVRYLFKSSSLFLMRHPSSGLPTAGTGRSASLFFAHPEMGSSAAPYDSIGDFQAMREAKAAACYENWSRFPAYAFAYLIAEGFPYPHLPFLIIKSVPSFHHVLMEAIDEEAEARSRRANDPVAKTDDLRFLANFFGGDWIRAAEALEERATRRGNHHHKAKSSSSEDVVINALASLLRGYGNGILG